MAPPELQDLDAEAAILGAALDDNSLWEQAASLTSDDFSHAPNALVFAGMRAMGGRGMDVLTLSETLKRMGQLANAGGPARIMELQTSHGYAWNIAHHVRTVRDMALRRAAVKQAQELMRLATTLYKPAVESLLEVSATLAKLGSGGADTILTGHDAMARFAEKMDAIQRGAYQPAIPTGVKVLDYLFGGLQRGTMTILGARPGIGKTALAETIAINRAHAFQEAQEAGKPCGRTGILWLEDPVEALVRRLVAYTSTIPVWRLAKEPLTGEGILKMAAEGMEAGAALTGDAWRIKEASGLSAAQASAVMRQMHAQHGVDLFIVDNLTEIELDEKAVRSGGESGATRDAIRQIRNVAKDLDVAVLLLIHLTRASSKDKDQQHQRPTLESGFGSSAIEKMARLIIFLWDDPEHKGYLAGFVPKQNEGAKYIDFWVKMHEAAALVLNTGGLLPDGTRGFTESADADGVTFIERDAEAA
jgi:replicative DNA helicase